MTYRERELLVSRSPPPPSQQQQNSQRSTSNNSNNRWIPSRLLPSQSLRIECKAEERHYIGNSSLHTINSSLKPIRFTMSDQLKPVQFRSEIIVHKNPETDLHIKRLRVAFHYPDDAPTNPIRNHQSASSTRSQSLHIPKPLSEQHGPIKKSSPVAANTLLHRWIDDICSNEQLMANDDIVFFIKNGEFFARI